MGLNSVCVWCVCALHMAGIITQKGLSNVTVDGLIQEITPKARGKQVLSIVYQLLTACYSQPLYLMLSRKSC